MSRDARLLFILLWTIADDSGRLRGNSRLLASLLYPYDADAGNLLQGWLSELEGQGCLACYEIGGHSYIQIKNWADHQKIDKPSASKLPPFVESSRSLANIREVSSEEGKGKERKGKEGSRDDLPIGIPPLRPEVVLKMRELGFLDPEFEATKFFDYWEGRNWERDGKPMKNWRSSCNSWKINATAKGDFPGVAPITKPKEPILGVDYLLDEKTGKRIPMTEVADVA